MIALFFMICALVGAAAGWGLYTFAEVQLTLAICGKRIPGVRLPVPICVLESLGD